MAQDIAAIGPEGSHGLPDRRIRHVRLLVDVAGVGDLAPGGALGAVDLGVGEGAQAGQAEARGERVDARVP